MFISLINFGSLSCFIADFNEIESVAHLLSLISVVWKYALRTALYTNTFGAINYLIQNTLLELVISE